MLFDEYHRQYSSPITFSSTIATVLSPGGGTLLPALLIILGAAYVGGVHTKGMELLGRLLERLFGGAEEEVKERADPLEGLSGAERAEAEEILKELESLGPYGTDKKRLNSEEGFPWP